MLEAEVAVLVIVMASVGAMITSMEAAAVLVMAEPGEGMVAVAAVVLVMASVALGDKLFSEEVARFGIADEMA